VKSFIFDLEVLVFLLFGVVLCCCMPVGKRIMGTWRDITLKFLFWMVLDGFLVWAFFSEFDVSVCLISFVFYRVCFVVGLGGFVLF